MSNTIPIPQPDAYEYLIADVWRTQTHWNGVKASAYRCLYATEKVHAHAAAVSASDNAALRAELDEWRFTNKVDELDRHVARQAERIKVLEDALNQIASWREGRIVGSYFDEPFAAEIARAALGDKT